MGEVRGFVPFLKNQEYGNRHIGNGLVVIVAFGCIFFNLKFHCCDTNISGIHRVGTALLFDPLNLIQSGRLRNDHLCLEIEVPVYFMQKSVSLCLADAWLERQIAALCYYNLSSNT